MVVFWRMEDLVLLLVKEEFFVEHVGSGSSGECQGKNGFEKGEAMT